MSGSYFQVLQPSLFPEIVGDRYVVKYHGSQVLHDDFRLRLGGVLLSWMVFGHLSQDPSVKIKATLRPYHDPQYMYSERVIPGGEIGEGPMLVWDMGVWVAVDGERVLTEDEIVKHLNSGYLELKLRGERLEGRFKLVWCAGDEWFVQKMYDGASQNGHEWSSHASILSRRELWEIH